MQKVIDEILFSIAFGKKLVLLNFIIIIIIIIIIMTGDAYCLHLKLIL